MIEVNPWLFLYGLGWALIGQLGALYFTVRVIEARARRRAKLGQQKASLPKIWKPGEQ